MTTRPSEQIRQTLSSHAQSIGIATVILKFYLPTCLFGLLLSLLALLPTAQAHLTTYTGAERSSTVAELWINADRITLWLEIGDRDRKAFTALLDHDASPPAPGKHGMVLTRDDDIPLEGQLRVVERRPRTNRAAAPQPSSEQTQDRPLVTYVEIVYALETRPLTLTLAPPRRDGSDEAAVEIGFIAYHEAIPVIDFQYLRRPETLRLDWRDPWYSAFDNPDLQRHHRAPLMTFLYIEPHEVRFEILIRLKALASWMSLDVQEPQQIGTDERNALRERIGQFFLQQSQVQIDGMTAHPILDRVEFVRATPQGIQSLKETEQLMFHTALVGVILAYITPRLPREVTADWTFFNDQITSIPSTIIDPVGQFPHDVTPAQPTLRWTNMLAGYNYQVATIDAITAQQAAKQLEVPLPSILLCLLVILLFGFSRYLPFQGVYRIVAMTLMLAIAVAVWPLGRVAVRNPFAAPYELPEIEAILILQELLHNTYRAFDFRVENDIYDKLAISVTGDLIADIYLQNRQRLAMKEQGGAQARVEDVQLLDAVQVGPPGKHQRLTFQCTWCITGTVNHWGHAHQRRNQYKAMITIQPIEHTWKMVALELIDERRLP